MKKFLLIAAAGLTAAFAANADGITSIDERPEYVADRLVNGSFDDPGFSQSTELAWNWLEYNSVNADSIPGWKRKEGIWNGSVGILEFTEDDTFEEWGINVGKNTQYVHYQYCTVNGWTGFGLEQRVDGLTPGTEYTLDMYVAHLFSNPDANIKMGFEIYAKPLVDGEETGPEIVKVQEALDAGYGEFDYYVHKFTPTSDGVIIRLMGYNWGGEPQNDNGNAWINWDSVRLYDPNDPAGVTSVAVDANAVQEIYNLQGVRMPADAELNGVYIVKNGNKVSKVVY